MAETEWELPEPPPPPGIDLEAGELLLIDWVLCGASHILPVHELEDLVPKWHEMRLEVWRGLKLLATGPKPPAKARYILSESEAEALLALLPTTHRWGTGPDCGYSVKVRLAAYLMGSAETPVEPRAEQAKPSEREFIDD